MAPIKPIDLAPTSQSRLTPLSVSRRGYLPIRAAPKVVGVGPAADGPEPAAERKEMVVPVEGLPLESKLQERMDQKMMMKMAKKIRLRRNRLLSKRHLRKRGRWPPSKMRKLKNVWSKDFSNPNCLLGMAISLMPFSNCDASCLMQCSVFSIFHRLSLLFYQPQEVWGTWSSINEEEKTFHELVSDINSTWILFTKSKIFFT